MSYKLPWMAIFERIGKQLPKDALADALIITGTSFCFCIFF